MRLKSRMPSPALAVASVAVVLALGGTGYAAGSQSPRAARFVALSKDSASDATPNKQIILRCPKGQMAVGGGAHLHYSTPAGAPVPLAIAQSRPNPDESKHPNAWVAAANATSAYSGNWSVEVHVICAR